MRSSPTKLVPLALALAVIMASCGTPAPQKSPSAPEAVPTAPDASTAVEPTAEIAGPKSGGTLISTLETEDPSTLDPIIPIDNAAIFTMLQIYDQLLRVSHENTLIPSAAESYEVSDDGMTYSFHMREGAKFADGSPVTVDDVIFSMERLRESEAWGHLIPAGTTIEPAGENDVAFRLGAPNAALPSNLALANASILPRTLVEEQGDAFFDLPVGSGPFKLKEWRRGERLVLERNQYYWDQPKPYLDEVVLELIPDENTRMLKFQAGELDVALGVPYAQVDAIDSIEGASVQTRPMFATQIVHLNTAVEPLDDPNVRKALQSATDRQAHIDAVLFGLGEPATMLWPKGLLYWDESVTGYPYDLEKAREYLAASKAPDGFDVQLTYTVGETAAEQSAALLKDEWAEIGVNVEIVPMEGTLHIDETIAGNYEASIIFWTSDVVDPSQLNISHQCGLTETMAGGCNEEFDTLSAEADTMTNETEREQAYHELFRIAEDWAWVVPLYYFPSRTAVWDYVKGFELAPTVFARYWEVWLEK